jgi:polyphosphate kinase 2 (PPK2 family)
LHENVPVRKNIVVHGISWFRRITIYLVYENIPAWETVSIWDDIPEQEGVLAALTASPYLKHT